MKKGALVDFVSAFGTSVPNVVIFQYNPETLRHSWSQPLPQTGQGQMASSPYAVSGLPGETFSFSLSMDATDQLDDPDPSVRLEAQSHGVYSRLAALEMLLYPVDPGAPAAGVGASGRRSTPAAQVPPVLFVWGTGRILPVRVTSLTITEKLYDQELNPTHAEAQVELRVLSPADLKPVTTALGELATSAYEYSHRQRKLRAAANLGASARAVTGMVAEKLLGG
jgi:hypothetical protein